MGDLTLNYSYEIGKQDPKKFRNSVQALEKQFMEQGSLTPEIDNGELVVAQGSRLLAGRR